MLNLLKKYKYKIIFWGLLGFIFCLFIIQLPYWIGRYKIIIKTDFNAADILAFLGNYISALGTIILGWIAIKQADESNDINERVEKLEKIKYAEDHKPVILIDWVKLHDTSYNNIACKVGFDGKLHYINVKDVNNINEDRQCIELHFINTGKSGVYNCKLKKITSYPDELTLHPNTLGVADSPFVLSPNESLKFNLYVYENIVERFATRKLEKIKLEFSCVNDFNEKYILSFDIEGAVVFMGNNRYEGQLVPSFHPVTWDFHAEKEDSNSI